jgi:16S rRNA (guanine527-N7)-methyltransferase
MRADGSILLAGTSGASVHLIESNKGKAAFLRTVARETGAPAIVHADRIETVVAGFEAPVDAVSARALAPFGDLLALSAPLSARGALLIFHKGQDFASEHAAAAQSWVLDLVEHPSRIDPGGRIVVVRALRPR